MTILTIFNYFFKNVQNSKCPRFFYGHLWAFMGIYGHLWTFSLIIHSLPFTVINYTQKNLILPKIYCFF